MERTLYSNAATTPLRSSLGPVGNARDEDCIAAIDGERVPPQPWDAPAVLQLCLLRGIRHHRTSFASGLRNTPGIRPEFVRAFNARDIMSDVIPDMTQPDEYPYCIWYPDVASEETYRALATRYPQMRYQVGRACAVAGYVDLYQELELLPDISIADEARQRRHNKGSQQIFDMILGPDLLRIMDDYTRSVKSDSSPDQLPYGLNGDTAVRSTLDMRRSFAAPSVWTYFGHGQAQTPSGGDDNLPTYFNITEDWQIDRHTVLPRPNSPGMLQLLWNPLAFHLPEGNKDILILSAAYYGDIDRYVRLRRPGHLLPGEANCITRGIYHHTPFAKWWSQQPENERYQHAINARFIMNNDVARITTSTPQWAIPDLIWYPARAHETTYIELVRRRPDMLPAAARSCLVSDYQVAWDELHDRITPSWVLFREAKASANPYYLEDLRRLAVPLGLAHLESERDIEHTSPLDAYPIDRLAEPSSTLLRPQVGPEHFGQNFDEGCGLYNGISADAGDIETYICAADELRPGKEYHFVHLARLYEERGMRPTGEVVLDEDGNGDGDGELGGL